MGPLAVIAMSLVEFLCFVEKEHNIMMFESEPFHNRAACRVQT